MHVKGAADMHDLRVLTFTATLAVGAVMSVTNVAEAEVAADSLDGSLIGGEWTSNARGSLIDEFAVLVDPFSGPEYFWLVTEAGLDGYSIDLSGDRVRFDFFFEEWVGGFIGTPSSWVFTDIDDTVADFMDVSLVDSFGSKVEWANMEIGLLNENQFYLDFDGLTSIDLLIRDGDFFELQLTIAPAPGSFALVLVGPCLRRRERSRDRLPR